MNSKKKENEELWNFVDDKTGELFAQKRFKQFAQAIESYDVYMADFREFCVELVKGRKEQGRQETLKEVYDLWIKSTDYLDFQTHFLEVLLNQRLEKQKEVGRK